MRTATSSRNSVETVQRTRTQKSIDNVHTMLLDRPIAMLHSSQTWSPPTPRACSRWAVLRPSDDQFPTRRAAAFPHRLSITWNNYGLDFSDYNAVRAKAADISARLKGTDRGFRMPPPPDSPLPTPGSNSSTPGSTKDAHHSSKSVRQDHCPIAVTVVCAS
jgi:hypothetical protein